MQVILGPNVNPDMFGPGLNGFKSMPAPPTQLTPEWFNSVQMEIVNVILGQSIVLDGLQFDQLKKALDDYAFKDPHITGSVTIDAGAMLFVANTATISVESGGGFVLENGSIFAVQSNVTLIADNNTWVWGDDNTNDWTINGNVTLGTDDVSVINLIGNVDIGFDPGSTGAIRGSYTLDSTSSISGGVGSVLDAETVEADDLRLVSTASVSTATGVINFGGRFVTVGISATAKRLAVFDESYVAAPANTGLAVADTGASVTITLAIGDVVMITASLESQNSIGGNRIRAFIDVNGVNVGSTANFLPPGANEPVTVAKNVEYTAAATLAYTFKLRHGAPDGGTTTTRDAYISVRHKH